MNYDEFKAGKYYPADIGDVYDGRYQVAGKVGFWSASTVRLVRNLEYLVSFGSVCLSRIHMGWLAGCRAVGPLGLVHRAFLSRRDDEEVRRHMLISGDLVDYIVVASAETSNGLD